MTSGRRSKARRAYERANTKLPERKPGDRGYAAFWRQEFGNAAPEIKALRNGIVGGKSIIAVMNVYGAAMNNTTGRSQLGQRALADKSGTSERVVRRVQNWSSEHGWLSVKAPAVPGVVGQTVDMAVGWLPDMSASRDVSASRGRKDVPASGDDVSASRDDVAASSGRGTLIENSHKNSQSLLPHSHPLHACEASCPAFFAPSFDGDEETLSTETPSGPLFEESSSQQEQAPEVEAPEVEMCENHLSYPKGDCHYCDRWKPVSNLPERKQEELHEKHNAEEGWDEYDDPGLKGSTPRYTGRKRH